MYPVPQQIKNWDLLADLHGMKFLLYIIRSLIGIAQRRVKLISFIENWQNSHKRDLGPTRESLQ